MRSLLSASQRCTYDCPMRDVGAHTRRKNAKHSRARPAPADQDAPEPQDGARQPNMPTNLAERVFTTRPGAGADAARVGTSIATASTFCSAQITQWHQARRTSDGAQTLGCACESDKASSSSPRGPPLTLVTRWPRKARRARWIDGVWAGVGSQQRRSRRSAHLRTPTPMFTQEL